MRSWKDWMRIGLLILGWGWVVWQIVVWLGRPAHLGALTEGSEVARQLGQKCRVGDFWCAGVGALGQVASVGVRRLGMLSGYLWWWVGAVVVWCGWRFVGAGRVGGAVRLSGMGIVGLFVVGVVGLFVVVANGKDERGMDVRLVVDPEKAVSGGNGEEWEALGNKFRELKGAGCLVGEKREGLYRISYRCVYGNLVTRMLPLVVVPLVVIFELLVLGGVIWHRWGWEKEDEVSEFFMSLGLGIGVWIVVLWMVGVVGWVRSWVGWGLVVGVPLMLWRESAYWLGKFNSKRWEVGVGRREWWKWVVGWVLLSYIVMNFLGVVRPFPIGWDDLNSYVDRPKQWVEFGHFIHSMSNFGWEYITAVPYILFGPQVGWPTAAALMVNFTAGVLAVVLVVVFVGNWMGVGWGVLAALFYYSLPMVGYFSFEDMKIDNVAFLISGLMVYGMMKYFEEYGKKTTAWRWLVVIGVMGGLGFSIKMTMIMVLLSVVVMVVGKIWNSWAAAGVWLWGMVMISLSGFFKIEEIWVSLGGGASTRLGVQLMVVGVGLALVVVGWVRKRSGLGRMVNAMVVVLGGFSAVVMPWLVHNNLKAGSVVGFRLEAPNVTTPLMDYTGRIDLEEYKYTRRSLPKEMVVDQGKAECEATWEKEELGRYQGSGDGWGHYLGLVWRAVMNADSVGYYVTTSPLLLAFLLPALARGFWVDERRWLRWVYGLTGVSLVTWVFLSSGVVWYGVGMFLGLVIGMVSLVWVWRTKWLRWVGGVAVVLALFLNISLRLKEFELQKGIVYYWIGRVSDEQLFLSTFKHYRTIVEGVKEGRKRVDSPYVYRVGTSIPFFIPRSLEVLVFNDLWLDTFNCLYQERDDRLTMDRLRALGIGSIIFDLNITTIEKDVNGSLHKKAEAFVSFLNNKSLGLKVVVNDQKVGVAYVVLPE